MNWAERPVASEDDPQARGGLELLRSRGSRLGSRQTASSPFGLLTARTAGALPARVRTDQQRSARDERGVIRAFPSVR